MDKDLKITTGVATDGRKVIMIGEPSQELMALAIKRIIDKKLEEVAREKAKEGAKC